VVHPPSSTWKQVLAAGECKVRTGPASAPCADGGISRAMAGGGNEVAIARDGSEGGERELRLLAQSFSRGRGHEVVVDRGGGG
jgi:hypothetical protein